MIFHSPSHYTPGPWKYGKPEKTLSSLGIWVAEIDSPSFLIAPEVRGMSVEECWSNARLIAAAPDLLAALKEMVMDLKKTASFGLNEQEVGMLQRAEKAITKATGGAQ